MRRLGRGVVFGLMLLLAVGFLAPVVWAILGALKPANELMLKPWALPSHIVWANFKAALDGHILRYLLNSAIVTVVSVALMLLIGVPAAYAFARLPMRGRGVLLGFAVSGILLPAQAVLIPVYRLCQDVHVANLPALVGPYVAFGLPLTILLLRTYFVSLPRELVDAAVVDGASHWRIAWQVFVPIAMPALATVAIFQAVWIWNELPLALVLVKDPIWQTLPVGLLSFQGEHTSNWGAILAGVTVAMTPVIALYVVLQKHVVRGLTAGAVKG